MATDLYRLRDADNMRDRDGTPVSPTGMLQRQLDRGFVFLRFSPPLEADFLRYLAVSGRPGRVAMLVAAFVVICVTPLVDRALFAMPDALVLSLRLWQFGMMLPLVIIAGVFCWWRPNSCRVEAVMILLCMGLVFGLLMQRIDGSSYGFDIPLEFVGIVVVAMFVLARIRFWLTLPIATMTIAAAVISEVWFVRPDPNGYYHLFSTLVLIVVGAFSGYSSEYFIRWTWINGTLLRYLSRLDSLTGMLNRKALETALDSARVHARRERLSYAVAMVDIDAFGAYNNHYGHPLGDAALVQVARVLQKHARRPQDACGRYGGEEFAVLWMDCDPGQARYLAESLRAAIERENIAHGASSVASRVTVSIGLCHVSATDSRISLESALCEADRALYDAKESGRNRVHCVRLPRLGCSAAAMQERSADRPEAGAIAARCV